MPLPPYPDDRRWRFVGEPIDIERLQREHREMLTLLREWAPDSTVCIVDFNLGGPCGKCRLCRTQALLDHIGKKTP